MVDRTRAADADTLPPLPPPPAVYDDIEAWQAWFAQEEALKAQQAAASGQPPPSESISRVPSETTTPTTTPSTPATSQTPEQREQELRSTLDLAAKIERGETQLPEDVDSAAYWKSIQDIRQKTALIDAYRAADQEMPPEARALVYGEAAPFVNLSTGTVDIVTAIKAGVPDEAIRALGISQIDIVKVKQATRQAAKEREVQTKVEQIQAEDAAKITADIKTFENWLDTEANDFLRSAYRTGGIEGYKSAVAEQDAVIGGLQSYRVPETGVYMQAKGAPPAMSNTYDLVRAVQDGKTDDLYKVFPKEAVDKAVATVAALKKLSASGGSPTWALASGRLTTEEAKLALGEEGSARYVSEFETYQRANAMLQHTPYEVVKPKSKNWGDVFDAAMRNNIVFAAMVSTLHPLSAGSEWLGARTAQLSEKAKVFASTIPSAPLQVAIRIPLGFASGVGEALSGGLSMLTFVTGTPTHLTDAEYYPEFKSNLVKGFVDIGKRAIIDPAWGAGEIAGLILGPAGVLKLAKTTAVKASPYYIPNTGMRFTFSTGKLPMKWGEVGEAVAAGKITEVQVANTIGKVINKAMENPAARATAQIGKTDIWVVVEPTPASAKMGAALWRATPERTPYTALERVIDVQGKEPAEFYSLQAAPRFAMMSAGGTPATAPALIMVYTKSGKLSAYPSSIQYASSLAEMTQKGFKYLGGGKATPGAYPPIKVYGMGFELEAMLPNGMKVKRVQNFQSRLLGAGAGEFVTTVKGWVLPIYRFAEEGAAVPKVSIADLAAIRVASITHGIRALLGKKGFGSESGYVDVVTLTRQFKQAGKSAVDAFKKTAKSPSKAKLDEAYNRAVDTAMKDRIRAVYARANPSVVEAAWRSRPEVFEAEYVNSLWRRMDEVTPRYRADPSLYRPESSYATIRTDIDERLIRDRAEDYYAELRSIRGTERAGGAREAIRSRAARTERVEPAIRALRYGTAGRVSRVAGRVDRPELGRINRPPRPDMRRLERIERIERIERTDLGRGGGGGGDEITTTPVLVGAQTSSLASQPVPEGSVAWVSGSRKGLGGQMVPNWFYIPPGYKGSKPISLNAPPIGAKTSGSLSPYDTIQVIGSPKKGVAREVNMDLGFADITILNGNEIRFSGRGLGTDVGTRIASNTIGMSTDEGEDFDTISGYPAVMSGRVTGHTESPKKAPKRRVSSEDKWYKSMTTLGGLKV